MIDNTITEGTRLIVRDIKEEMESAFIDYSMSVITARALPDVRDGLKPVHRRIPVSYTHLDVYKRQPIVVGDSIS